ncbi:MAG: hypothetical protein JO368_03720 [Acidimicrobiales bacterium]|nr:hypothetical protein [Acidimicrobiales bacterium]
MTGPMTEFGNMAAKVADLDAALDFYRGAGAEIRDRGPWHGGERADVYLGSVQLTLFTRALYEDTVDLPEECFLHLAVFTDDLDAALEGREVRYGPTVVEGVFGRRRIAFVDAPGGYRLEFMQQLAPPAP